MSKNVYEVYAFSKDRKGGNPAGVVVDVKDLTEKEMQQIARDLKYSETAFVMSSQNADFKVRFFTPSDEVDLCGHATIATFHALNELNHISIGEYTQETKAGVLEVKVQQDRTILMEQNIPEFYCTIDRVEVADSLGIEEKDLVEEIPVEIVSTGLKDIIVPVKALECLNSMKLDLEKIAEISKRNDAVGYHVFTMETLSNATAHCRNMAPLVGIDEESATGTSNGALACYLFKHDLIDAKEEHLSFEQGYTMGQPSTIYVKLNVSGDSITQVWVGGKAYIKTEKILE